MIMYRKPPTLKDMLVRAKTAQPGTTSIKDCHRPNTCKYCIKSPNQGEFKTWITNPTIQSPMALARAII